MYAFYILAITMLWYRKFPFHCYLLYTLIIIDLFAFAYVLSFHSEKNVISIWNNGKGIPIEMHAEQKVYVPTLIFGQLLTSSNYDDTQKKITGGRNGFGAKLCNIYSKKFSIETACGEYGKKFKQVSFSSYPIMIS